MPSILSAGMPIPVSVTNICTLVALVPSHTAPISTAPLSCIMLRSALVLLRSALKLAPLSCYSHPKNFQNTFRSHTPS
eukprot:2272880-Rhodomonas_salina.1